MTLAGDVVTDEGVVWLASETQRVLDLRAERDALRDASRRPRRPTQPTTGRRALRAGPRTIGWLGDGSGD